MSNKFLSKMLYALTSAYSRKDYDNVQLGLPLETNIGKLFSILAWGLETVEEQAELVRLWDDLDYASGSVLDRYGANFGVKRVSSDDRFYRLAIKVKIMAQLSGGDTGHGYPGGGDAAGRGAERCAAGRCLSSQNRPVRGHGAALSRPGGVD